MSSEQSNKATGQGVQHCTLDDLSKIRQTAESLNPGVSSRVSAADYESIVVAVLSRFAVSTARRANYTPAPSVALEMARTIETLSSALRSSSPQKGNPPLPAQPKLQVARVSRAAKTGAQPSTSGVVRSEKKTPTKSITPSGGAIPPSSSKSEGHKLLKQCLRSLKSKGWKQIASKLKVDEEAVKVACAKLKEEDIALHDKSVPPLIRIGVIDLNKLDVGNWSDETDLDGSIRAAIRRSKEIFDKSKDSGIPPERAGSMIQPPLGKIRAAPWIGSTVAFKSFKDAEVPEGTEKWRIPALLCHPGDPEADQVITSETGVSFEELPERLRCHSRWVKTDAGCEVRRVELTLTGLKGWRNSSNSPL